MSVVFEPGFFACDPVRTALLIGAVAAVVSGVVGVFTVMRGQSFAGEALADVASAGGPAALIFGVNPLLGFLGMGVLAAAAMELVVVRQARERDLVTGVVMGAGLGLTALFLYFDVTLGSTTGVAVTVMFGSMFVISPGTAYLGLGVGAITLAAVAILYRPLLLTAVDPDLAEVRGVNVRLVGLLHLLVLALAVSLCAMTVGAILSTALLVGPPAIALRAATRPGWAIVIAALIGVIATWGGILMAYDSYYWTPGHSWPVSFCIVALIFLIYLASVFPGLARLASPRPAAGAAAPRTSGA